MISNDVRKRHIGHTSQWIYIYAHPHPKCSATGMPLSMILFVLCLNPLLYYLDESLQGTRTHGTQLKTTVIAYADGNFGGGRENSPRRHSLLREGNWRNPECCEI